MWVNTKDCIDIFSFLLLNLLKGIIVYKAIIMTAFLGL